MKISDVITRLISQGNFDTRVRGAAEFIAATAGVVAGAAPGGRALQRSLQLDVPHAWVVPRSWVPLVRPESEPVGVFPPFEEVFSVIVALDNRVDQRGDSASDVVETVRDNLQTDLVGFVLDANHGPIQFGPASELRMEDDILWWDFRFTVTELASTATGSGMWTIEQSASVVLSTIDAEAFRQAVNTKIDGDAWTGITTVTELLGWDTGRSAITPSDTTLYYSTRCFTMGQPDLQRSNLENPPMEALEAGLGLTLYYAPTSGSEDTIVDRIDDWLAQLQVWSYLELSGVREVVNPFRLTFPDDVTRS